MITAEEYVQLKAFARQDGALLALLWVSALVCYILGLTNPIMGMAAMLFIVVSPFYAAYRLRHFRDYGREGVISFSRGYAYLVLTFFYAGVLLAAALFGYFTFIDNGYLLSQFTELVHSEQGRQAMQMYGMTEEIEAGLQQLAEMRPIDYALNMLTINIMTGFLLGVPIAALMQRQAVSQKL